jgi:hypothetical protein
MSDKNPVGRPSEYKPEYCKMAEVFCRKGATDKELGELFGVSDTTINNWKNQHPEFLASLKNGKDIADNEVEKALYKRALGYKTTEKTVYKTKKRKNEPEHVEYDDDGELVEPLKETPPIDELEISRVDEKEKDVAPDTTAGIFWLKNRRPDQWRDRREHKHEGSVEVKTIEQLVKDKEGK